MRSIGDSAFSYCPRITSIVIPEGITSIGSNAFDDCNQLTRIDLPDSLMSIGTDAFFNCNNLKQITIPRSTTEIGSWPFFPCNMLETILVDDGNPKYSSLDGVLFSKDTKTLIRYPQGKTESTYCIPAGVVNIGDGAFMDCQNLEAISISTTVKQINACAFYGCANTKQFVIPNGVTTIGSRAFDQSGITKITFPEGVKEWGICILWSNIHLEQIEFLDKSPTDALSRCIIEDELIMPNLKTIYVPYGTKELYQGILEEYFHSYIQEREKEWHDSNLGDIFSSLESAGKNPLKRPTLILSEDGQDLLGVGYLSFEIIETGKKAITYEVDLYDAWGREIALPGECKLIFPYPEGITINNHRGWRVKITHYGEDQTTKYSSEDGSIEFLPLGLCIRVSSLSPFVIEWEKSVTPEVLPQTGDNTSLPMYVLVLLLSLALICRLNRKRINV